MMYFALWLVVFVIHWLRKIKHSVNLRGHGRVTSYRMSLMAHLVSDDDDSITATGEDIIDDDDHSSTITTPRELDTLCRRFRFLRAFEFLLLFSYETFVEQALQLVNCIGVGSCGPVLAEFPDVACPNNAAYIPLLVVAALLLIYAVAFPVGLFAFLRKHNLSGEGINSRSTAEQLPKLRHTEQRRELVQAKFGVFFRPLQAAVLVVGDCGELYGLNLSLIFSNSNALLFLAPL